MSAGEQGEAPVAARAAPEPPAGSKASAALPRAVVGLGLVSLLTDASSEAIFPLLPAFLATLGASNTFIGLVEGAAELVANSLKYATGLLADRRARLKPLVLAGYVLSTAARPLVAFAAVPWHVLAVRLVDRVGKGVRTSPRDALIAAAAEPSIRARAYGFHRAMDHAGAAVGTLLGAGILWSLGARGAQAATAEQLRTVFLWAAVPGVLAVIALALTPEPRRAAPRPRARRDGRLPPALRRALVPLGLFAFANATDAFILVKLARLGGAPILAPLLWLALHVVKAATATAGGRLADRYGKRDALALGWTVYAVAWSAIGFAETVPALFVLGAVYGISHGLVEGAERALVAELAAGNATGKAFGVYNMLVGLAALAASTTFGFVWDALGSAVAFAGSGALALLAALALLKLVPRPA
ncbi:MFS transporter [Anaeromyxobacter sp. Fw109-5]|uniref:MFS transporter n=1 Tax=Anaeromyxobacter sp. (strain Fw109-5) TaxID=404589 RepID=UPI000158A59F|nr:MFS transporter [Anaeromyxobacter sp. Fw109-5]ABS24780.1 major facilitator superfamily MFS_1 [Anaeromyxobacter sp. Fw109-5]